jgi:hypothetical protein
MLWMRYLAAAGSRSSAATGAKLELRFYDLAEEPIDLSAEVIWARSREGNRLPPAAGLSWNRDEIPDTLLPQPSRS